MRLRHAMSSTTAHTKVPVSTSRDGCSSFYTGSVDLSSITNEKKKRQLESMINNFGQTPTQLFFEPHPPRLSLQEARKLLAAKFSISGQNSARSIFENLKELRAFSVEVYAQKSYNA